MEGIVYLRFLGPVQVEREGKPVRGFRSRKALALLGYLAAQKQPVSREGLVDLFWEGITEARGRANLSWALNHISSQLPACLQTERHTVQFQRASPYRLDIDVFAELEAQGGMTALAATVELYRGEFLEGLSLDGCVEFELWLVKERERWRRRVARVLAQLVRQHSERGEYEQGLRYAQRLLDVEPWREETHRQMMRLLAYTDQRSAALAQYETCCHILAEELDVAPAAETTRLYEQIRDGQLEIPVAPPDPFPLPAFLLDKEEPLARPVFVARQAELAQLDEFLDKALAGQGQVVFVTGNAGQGKTALIQEFVRRAQETYADLVVAGGSGNAHTGLGDPYLPFREILGLLTGDVQTRWAAGAMSQDQARRLWQTLPLAAPALVETGPDLIDLFVPGAALLKRAATVAPGETDWLPQLQELVGRKTASPPDPSLQQSALFEQYSRVLETLARRSSLLLVLDDLQWADAGSTSLLFHLGRRIESSRILIVGAYRPAEVTLGHPAPGSRPGERHPLEPVVNEFKRRFGSILVNLGQAEGRLFVDALLDAEPNRLGHAFRETLYRQTGGHPLFTVELLQGMRERGGLVQDETGQWIEGPALEWETLPARVEAVIAERIGRLPEQLRDVLTVASVEGETFTAEVIARVLASGEQEIIHHLSSKLDRQHHLVHAQGIRRLDSALNGTKGGQRLSLYRFRHILFQRYLYNNVDQIERAHLHQNVGTALEALYREATEEFAAIAPVATVAGQLARHFQEAGITEKAVSYFRRGGERAARLSAHQEAIAHFTQGLALLETLPDTPQRIRLELPLQLALGVSFQAIRGYAVPEVGRAFGRARELCQQAGKTPQLFPALRLLSTYYSTRGEYRTGHEIAGQLLSLAERVEDPLLVAVAHLSLGWSLLFLGEFTQTQAHLEQAIAFYESQQQQQHSLAFTYGFDHGVACLSFASWTLWALGYPDQARQRSQEALALAQELSHPLSMAFAHSFAGILNAFRRDVPLAQTLAEACIRLSTEHGFPYWLASGIFLHGWTLTKQGQTKKGLDQIRQGIADYQATGAGVGRSHQLASLAEAYRQAGQVEEGLAVLAEALATVNRTGERFYEAEVHRLRGELLLKDEGGRQKAEAAEECFHQAIKVARQQQARSWELRAVMSLGRLWSDQGKREEARKLLADVYGWFSEGFDTPDLQEARKLMEDN
ncbi:MAG: AAA family ATPase [Anaerolineae bacterium]|nr:AAA family ATPase [Anaerolineae bacterium]